MADFLDEARGRTESVSQLIEEEVGEYGEQFLLSSLTARREDINNAISSGKTTYATTLLNKVSPGNRVLFPARIESTSRYPRLLQLQPYALSSFSGESMQPVAVNATVFYSLDAFDIQFPILANFLATIRDSNDPVPPIPATAAASLRPEYRTAQSNVARVSAVTATATAQFQGLLGELGAAIAPDEAGERTTGELFSSFSEVGFWSTLTGVDAEQQNLINLAIDTYLWYFYASYISNAPSTESADPETIATQGTLRDIAQIFVDHRARKYILEAIRNRVSEITNQTRARATSGRDEVSLTPPSFPDNLTPEEADRVRARIQRDRSEIRGEITQAIREQGGEDPPLPEQARLRRFAEQCFLLDYLPDYAKINQDRNPTYVHESTAEPDFHMLHGRTETIINKLMYNPQLELLDNMRPSEFSGLVPQIRLYKVFSELNADGSRGQSYEQEIPFGGSVSPGEVASMINNSFDRGQGVGLKSFDWRLEGQNPFTARRDIFGELKLFFQNLDELVKPRSTRALFNDGTEGTDKTFRYVDLVNIGLTPQNRNSQTAFVWNPDYYQIKVDVGWASPDGALNTNLFQDPLMATAIEQSRMTLFLSAVDHTIDINDQGNVNLSIEYIAYQEASYQDADSDILSDRVTRDRRLRSLKTIQTARASGCSAEQLSELRQEYTEDVRAENFRNYSRIIKTLFDKERIFFTMVNTIVLDSYINDGRTQSSQPLVDRVFGAPSPVDVRANTATNAPVGSDRAPGTLDGSSPPRNEEELRKRLQDLSYDENQDVHALQFFYFGDLLQIALEQINSSTSGTEEQLSSESKVEKDLQILLGPMSYLETVGRGDSARSNLVYDINLADIPISVNYYIDWFLGAVIAQERTIYPLLNFIRDVANNLLGNMMRTQCHGLNNVERENLQLRTSFFNASGVDPLGEAKNMLAEPNPNDIDRTPGGAPTYRDLEGSETRINVDKLFQARESPLPLRPPRPGRRSTKYMLLYAMAPGTTENLTGNPAADKLRGIYHLGIGRDRGILNSIKFNKTDIAGLREARLENSFLNQMTGLAILSNVYDVEIKCAGNTMFYPGMKIYLDPRGLSPGIGSPATPGSTSNVLGIGGYHTIHKVRSYVESGKFETTIDAIFESAARSLTPGSTAGSEQEEGAQSGCDESIGESIRDG